MRTPVWAGLAAALLLGSVTAALADPAGPPPLPAEAGPAAPPPDAPPPVGGYAAINIDMLKAIFDAAKIPVEMKTTPSGRPLLVATLGGYVTFSHVLNCSGDDPHGQCGAIEIDTGLTTGAVSDKDLAAFNRQTLLAKAMSFDEDHGRSILSLIFKVTPGVGPTYIQENYKRFTVEAQIFFERMAAVETGAPVGTGPGFSSDMATLPLDAERNLTDATNLAGGAALPVFGP